MPEERCDCCDLPLYLCGVAAERRSEEIRRAENARAMQEPGVVAARFPTRCVTCGTAYRVGDPIRRADDDSGWSGAVCCPRG